MSLTFEVCTFDGQHTQRSLPMDSFERATRRGADENQDGTFVWIEGMETDIDLNAQTTPKRKLGFQYDRNLNAWVETILPH